jgi:glycosyltransferase involved in cell wall biosynthesis
MISIVIPCYNCYDCIDRAFNSILVQTFKDIEVILVDNNSTDNTYQKLLALKNDHPELVKVFKEDKKGAPAARNKGLMHAKGEYIQFLDADDQLKPHKLETQYNIAKSEGAEIVIGNHVLQYNIDGEIKSHVKYAETNCWEGLVTSNLGITSANLWNKRSVIKAGGWDNDLTSSQEYDLLFRLLKNDAKFAFDKSVQTIIHKSANSISKSTNQQKLVGIITNRINLRHRIKLYLAQTGKLSNKLDKMIDTYIYNELMTQYNDIPDFVRQYLKSNKLNVFLLQSFKIRLRHFLKKPAAVKFS